MTTRVGGDEYLAEQLRDAQRLARRYRAALDNVVDAIVIIGPDGLLSYANEAAVTMLGAATPHVGDDAMNVIHPDDRDRTVTELAELVDRPGEGACVQFRVQTRTGWLWVEATARNRLDDDDVDGIVVSFRDLTHVRALERLARHDPLTGLTNRTALQEALRAALARRAAEPTAAGNVVAVLFIDLDRFKLVNDSLGHGVGDELLVQVAARLQRLVPEAGTITRFGGDEFVILLDGLESADQADAVADRVLEGLSTPFAGPRSKLHLGASIGIAIADEQTTGPEELLSNADAALYQAKARRGSRQGFTPDLREALRVRIELESELRRALDTNELVVHYQPIVDVRSGAVTELEALVRWAHPRRGLLGPASFLGMADDSGLIEAIGDTVLRRVALDLVSLAARGWAHVGVAVNLSPSQLVSSSVVSDFTSALRTSGTSARLTAEITEHALGGNLDQVMATVVALQAAGVRVAIDDFGIGHTSLGHLVEVPVDVIKLDQSFVQSLSFSPRRRAVVASVIELVHALGLPVVGEGVETADQHRLLTELGCDQVQGFLLGRPLPLDEVLDQARPASAPA